MHLRRHPGDHHGRLAPIDLSLRTRFRAQRHEHLVDELAELLTALTDIPADLPLGHLNAMLVTEPFVDPLRGVPLLARRRRSASSHESISSRHSPSFGAGRPTGRLAPRVADRGVRHGGARDAAGGEQVVGDRPSEPVLAAGPSRRAQSRCSHRRQRHCVLPRRS